LFRCIALHCNGTTTTAWRGEHSLRSRWFVAGFSTVFRGKSKRNS
jgi:hypothetical protein